jgi:hypothetical protein
VGGGGATTADPASPPEPDCAYPLVWDGITYDPGIDLPAESELGPRLGTGVVLGCGDPRTVVIPDEAVDVSGIERIEPAVAVAATLDSSSRPVVWLAPGYLTQSPRHPLHLAVADAFGEQMRDDGFTCGPALETRARALTTPRREEPLQVAADDAYVESLLVEPGTQRVVSLDADTKVLGLERHGVPYVERGDEFELVLRACDGKETEPGLAGLRLLFADSLTGEG